MHKTLKSILEGVYDPDCVLNTLLGKPHIIQIIWNMIKHNWKRHLKMPSDYDEYYDSTEGEDGTVIQSEIEFIHQCQNMRFPSPTNINVNMMPFIASRDFEKTKLPEYIKPYKDMLWSTIGCAYGFGNINRKAIEGKVFFLTIQESWVDANTSQRRSGLHTDNPGPISIRKSQVNKDPGIEMLNYEGPGSCDFIICDHHWGTGVINNARSHCGGIYMASNVENSCRVWDCKIEADRDTGEEVISDFGDIEHLRSFLPDEDAEILEPNTLYWITDRTPHESLPLEKGQFRQFFRIVTSDVSLWFVDDNTENPNGVKPDPSITKIVKGSKFNPSSLEIIT